MARRVCGSTYQCMVMVEVCEGACNHAPLVGGERVLLDEAQACAYQQLPRRDSIFLPSASFVGWARMCPFPKLLQHLFSNYGSHQPVGPRQGLNLIATNAVANQIATARRPDKNCGVAGRRGASCNDSQRWLHVLYCKLVIRHTMKTYNSYGFVSDSINLMLSRTVAGGYLVAVLF